MNAIVSHRLLQILSVMCCYLSQFAHRRTGPRIEDLGNSLHAGADGRTRTGTPIWIADFKSAASTISPRPQNSMHRSANIIARPRSSHLVKKYQFFC